MLEPVDAVRLRRLTTELRSAEQPIRILRTLAWPPEVRERFFADGEEALPVVAYQPPAIDDTLRRLEAIRTELGDAPEDQWLGRQAEAIEHAARMLAGAGTPELTRHSIALYGTPASPSVDGKTPVIDLATHLDGVLAELANADLGEPPPACYLADYVAEQMTRAVQKHFGDDAPVVEVVDELSANALAGPRRIRIRRGACFTDLDVRQLIHHEALIHVATALNGRLQVDLPILGAGHAGTTRTQEGLAVLAEMISGTLDPDRLRRLARRVLAIQMALDGADFLDVYRFFRDAGIDREQAFESARRVFRGGVLTGGAPFTKDGVYLDGLLRVHSFLRAAVGHGRADLVRVLFCGKLDVDDVPFLTNLQAQGLCRPARYLPPWAADLRFLAAYLSMSAFFNRLDLDAVRARYADALRGLPPVTR